MSEQSEDLIFRQQHLTTCEMISGGKTHMIVAYPTTGTIAELQKPLPNVGALKWYTIGRIALCRPFTPLSSTTTSSTSSTLSSLSSTSSSARSIEAGIAGMSGPFQFKNGGRKLLLKLSVASPLARKTLLKALKVRYDSVEKEICLADGQIHGLPFNSFRAHFSLNDGQIFHGRALNLSQISPLVVTFDLPSAEVASLVSSQIESEDGLDIGYEASFAGSAYDEYTMIQERNKIKERKFMEEIFGDGDFVHVTRDQWMSILDQFTDVITIRETIISGAGTSVSRSDGQESKMSSVGTVISPTLVRELLMAHLSPRFADMEFDDASLRWSPIASSELRHTLTGSHDSSLSRSLDAHSGYSAVEDGKENFASTVRARERKDGVAGAFGKFAGSYDRERKRHDEESLSSHNHERKEEYKESKTEREHASSSSTEGRFLIHKKVSVARLSKWEFSAGFRLVLSSSMPKDVMRMPTGTINSREDVDNDIATIDESSTEESKAMSHSSSSLSSFSVDALPFSFSSGCWGPASLCPLPTVTRKGKIVTLIGSVKAFPGSWGKCQPIGHLSPGYRPATDSGCWVKVTSPTDAIGFVKIYKSGMINFEQGDAGGVVHLNLCFYTL